MVIPRPKNAFQASACRSSNYERIASFQKPPASALHSIAVAPRLSMNTRTVTARAACSQQGFHIRRRHKQAARQREQDNGSELSKTVPKPTSWPCLTNLRCDKFSTIRKILQLSSGERSHASPDWGDFRRISSPWGSRPIRLGRHRFPRRWPEFVATCQKPWRGETLFLAVIDFVRTCFHNLAHSTSRHMKGDWLHNRVVCPNARPLPVGEPVPFFSMKVSKSTVRHDLDFLEDSGVARRTSGGILLHRPVAFQRVEGLRE